MTDETIAEIPTEIPWKLAASLQPSVFGRPSNRSIALFTYEPRLDSLKADYPDSRLLYFKLTVSLSPLELTPLLTAGESAELWWSILNKGLPVWTALLELHLRTDRPSAGNNNAYFIAAAPLRREMIETGIIGHNQFEGASDGLAVGKSGSQMHETSKTDTTTHSDSSGGGFPFIYGYSTAWSRTAVTGERNVLQVTDSTSRDASQERRELLSHTTNVNNILTLLTATLLGTPNLQFTLRSRPLSPVAMDPGDPNLWYSELLRRRSSGIEGMQDFYAIAVVPNNVRQMCMDVKLTTLHLFDLPLPAPPRPSADDPFDPHELQMRRQALEFIHRRYPIGTPIDELDRTLRLENPNLSPDVNTATILNWVAPLPTPMVQARVGYYDQRSPGNIREETVPYKFIKEVSLERDREEVARSPLERGVPITLSTNLTACFRMQERFNGQIPSINIETQGPKLPAIQFTTPRMPNLPNSSSAALRAAVLASNDFDTQLALQFSSDAIDRAETLRLDDNRLITLVLERARTLSPGDPANVRVDKASSWLKLHRRGRELLSSRGITNLRDVAVAILNAQAAEQGNELYRQTDENLTRSRAARTSKRMTSSISVDEANDLRREIGRILQSRLEQSIARGSRRKTQIQARKVKPK